MPELLAALQAAGAVAALDVAFAALMARLSGPAATDALRLAAALVSRRVADGDVCLVLSEHAGTTLGEVRAPAGSAWTRALRASPVVGEPGERRPLVLDGAGRLYLWRYWDYEQRLAAALRGRATERCDDVDITLLTHDLDLLFPAPADGAPDWQRLAAATAVLRRLVVISGGPGTGKTHTVSAVLGLLASQAAARGAELRIGLAAPTGKAAARMQEAIRGAAVLERLTPEVRACIPETASTLHRLLGARPDSVYFRHHRDHPLPLDVVVVDEASMVDLALMAKLVDALPASARLVLLGDRDQLASVEAGAVLGDVCGPAPGFSREVAVEMAAVTGARVPAGRGGARSPLRDAVVVLQRSWRFDARSGIGQLAAAVNAGDADGAVALLEGGAHDDLGWADVSSPEALRAQVVPAAVEGFAPYVDAVARGDVAGAFAAFARFRILCAHRHGPAGVQSLGHLVEDALAARGLLHPEVTWYRGRPVMVTRNDHAQRLFNGDVGIALPDADGALAVWFEAPGGGHRRVSPARVPEHETVWTMTVHKSQGSEFDRVLLVLPLDPSRITTRELLYTAITRARRHVTVWGTRTVVQHAVGRRLTRSSGLRDALWNDRGAGTA